MNQEHEDYLADMRAFRAAHGYAANYQEGWREKGPRPESDTEKRQNAEIKAFYNERRKAREYCGD